MHPSSPKSRVVAPDQTPLASSNLSHQASTGSSHGAEAGQDSPLSFKRTAPPPKLGGMLRGLLNRAPPDRVPSLRRPDAPSHIDMPHNRNTSAAYSSALATDEDEDEFDGAGQRTPTDIFSASSRLRPSKHRPSRVSFGTGTGVPRMRRPSAARRVSGDYPADGKEPPAPLPGLIPQTAPESNVCFVDQSTLHYD